MFDSFHCVDSNHKFCMAECSQCTSFPSQKQKDQTFFSRSTFQ